jgi:hypothetical protein
MGSGNRDRTQKTQEASGYREAAELALDQLDWCISYLHRIRKPAIAEELRKNRKTIAVQLAG